MTNSTAWDDGVLQVPDGFRGVFRTDDRARAVYSESAGIARILPDAVAVPADADDVVTLVQWAAARGVPIVARGSATSMANGALGRGVALDLSRLNWIGAVDAPRATVPCGPGALRDAVDAAARGHGLRVGGGPVLGAFCTIGGMVATNAAGSRSVKLGAMRPWVRGLDCIFADGSRAWVRRGEPRPRIDVLRTFQHDVGRGRARPRRIARPPGCPQGIERLRARRLRTQRRPRGPARRKRGHARHLRGHRTGARTGAGGSQRAAGVLPDARRCGEGGGHATVLGASAVELLDRTFLDVVRAEASALSIPPARTRCC